MTTNGISDGTNGIHADAPSVDVLDELRHYADDVRYDYNPIDDAFVPDERLSELCRNAADAIEARNRLIAKARNSFKLLSDREDDSADMLRRACGRAVSIMDDEMGLMGIRADGRALEAERGFVSREKYDEMEAALEAVLEAVDIERGLRKEAEAERDEWAAKAEGFTEALEKLGCSVLANGTVFGPTEAKSAKRAAAVERLKNDTGARFSPDAIVCALLDGRRGKIDWSLECDAILDLLTDDDGVERSNDGATNLEWLFEHDREKLIAMASESCDCATCVYGWHVQESWQCADERWTAHCTEGNREWLMAPHEDDSGKENDPETPDSAENPQKTPECMQKDNEFADCGQIADMSEKGGGCVCNDSFTSEVGVRATDVDANDANATQDSREKLEDRWYAHGGVMQLTRENVEKLRGIVMPYHNGEKQAKLMGKQFDRLIYDELHDTREKLEADCEKLICKIRKRIFSGRDETALRYQIHELLDRQGAITWRECREYENALREQHHKRVSELQSEIDKRDRGIARLKRQRDEARAERDMWRMRCGELLDAAHAVQAIADAWADE